MDSDAVHAGAYHHGERIEVKIADIGLAIHNSPSILRNSDRLAVEGALSRF